jgi:hypothetical protein
MKRRLLAFVAAIALIGASAGSIVVTGQALDYERGYFFFTSGDAFKVAPDVTVVNGPVQARRYARVTFDGSGTIVKIELSRKKFPPEGDLASVSRYAVAMSTPAPNPELGELPPSAGRCARTQGGKLVAVTVVVQVPPSTSMTDSVYMTSDQSAWNSQAYRLDRIDALHYHMILKLYSGTFMHVLFDRGSTQSIQVGENGIEVPPYVLCIGDEDAQAFRATVRRWGDETNNFQQQIPQTLPTPYNPAPFPNLPTPVPTHAPIR